MCIGIPMQVCRCDGLQATCARNGETEVIDLSLVGPQPEGTWVMVFLGAAREVLSPEIARQALDAVTAVEHIMMGTHEVDHLFSDLIDQEPQLPEHLRPLVGQPLNTTGDTTDHDLPSD